jgi:valyl-tRNA synthetase
VPSGYTEAQRGVAGGFIGEVDIMDTWATSSLTPQLAGGWISDPEKYSKVFPFDLRPQGQDIIRTWLFSTLLRSHQESGQLPWSNAAISGWILDPDRKKMSKSKGNVVVPAEPIDNHGADAVRYWAAAARLGTDAAFDEGQMKVGRRLAIKVLNAAKFALSFEVPAGFTSVTEPIDQSMLLTLADVVDETTAAFENYDHTKALELTEGFFWRFTDDYLELVKERAYGQGGVTESEQASAAIALRMALHTLLRLFAPFIPFTAEEVWSWWQAGSIHRAAWPVSSDLRVGTSSENATVLANAALAVSSVRKAKSDAKVSMKASIQSATIKAPSEVLASLRLAAGDLRAVGKIWELSFAEGEATEATDIVFAEESE